LRLLLYPVYTIKGLFDIVYGRGILLESGKYTRRSLF
jgi:hypothetical protein